MTEPDKKLNRQDFFRSFFKELYSGIEEAFGDELTQFANDFAELIRPPGALPENDFLEKCARCGACIRSCPFHALAPVLTGNSFDRGTPMLRVGQSYCRLFQDFPCITACPSGALPRRPSETPRISGKARILQYACRRTHGEDCRACQDRCDALSGAITCTAQQAARVDSSRCTGCGACVTVCPADPEIAIKLIR